MSDVLLVEDDDDLRTDLAFLLERKGFSVATASNGQQALAHIRDTGVPRLILLDLMMPHMDGWTLRQVLLQHPMLEKVPVVIFSGTADVEEEARLLGTPFLTKPVDLERLYQVVAAHC
ncbi:MAG: response regulator [Deltaproteobacteria bacterium]|nr:response regulator [Deltaproteobacteria bacterium]